MGFRVEQTQVQIPSVLESVWPWIRHLTFLYPFPLRLSNICQGWSPPTYTKASTKSIWREKKMEEISGKQSGIGNENLGQIQAWKNCNPVVCVQHITSGWVWQIHPKVTPNESHPCTSPPLEGRWNLWLTSNQKKIAKGWLGYIALWRWYPWI